MQSSCDGAIYEEEHTAEESCIPQQPAEMQFKNGIPILAITAEAQAPSHNFDMLWDTWLQLSKIMCWKELFPVELKHIKTESELDSVDDLMELDVLHGVYERLIEDKTLGGGVGRLPLLALCYIGNNLASSFCERVNSCAKLVMTHDRTVLNDGHLEKVCWLRMNRSFMTYMKVKHQEIAKQWQKKSIAALL